MELTHEASGGAFGDRRYSPGTLGMGVIIVVHSNSASREFEASKFEGHIRIRHPHKEAGHRPSKGIFTATGLATCSFTCMWMECVTPPVEVSPKEARHLSMQTRALWNGIIISLSRKRLIRTTQLEPKP